MQELKEQIALFLTELAKDKGISRQEIQSKTGLSEEKINAIFCNGSKNYDIDSFLLVLRAIGVHLEFSDLAEKNNWQNDSQNN